MMICISLIASTPHYYNDLHDDENSFSIYNTSANINGAKERN